MSSQKRYLVLHGYKQSGDIIAKKFKGFLGKDVTLVTPDGPLLLDNEQQLYGWFPLELIDLTNGKVEIRDTDITDIIDHIGKMENNYYDGVVAFSQGCLAASLLVGTKTIITNKLLLFSPIPVPDEWPHSIKESVSAKIYIGLKDDLVYPRFSMKFIPTLGENPVEVIEHRWGHVIPSTSEHRKNYVKFLTDS